MEVSPVQIVLNDQGEGSFLINNKLNSPLLFKIRGPKENAYKATPHKGRIGSLSSETIKVTPDLKTGPSQDVTRFQVNGLSVEENESEEVWETKKEFIIVQKIRIMNKNEALKESKKEDVEQTTMRIEEPKVEPELEPKIKILKRNKLENEPESLVTAPGFKSPGPVQMMSIEVFIFFLLLFIAIWSKL